MVLSERLNNFVKNVIDFFTDVFAFIAIVILTVFVFGELYALYFTDTMSNAFMLWLPVGVLMILLFAKAVE